MRTTEFAIAYAKLMPACNFAAIFDVIDSNETGNDALLEERPLPRRFGARVWHMHENLHRRERLTSSWPRVCIGRASAFAQVGMAEWWVSTGKAMGVAWDEDGRPTCKLHGRWMLDPAIFDDLPFSSADSTNIGRTIGVRNA
ncbi:hypothetical protein E8E95_07950 [Pseudomonas sp. BN414]|uniref:hypothetical protein n=1 Tax=Pseudomonas sp. BN414 TaxID=2567888 RepID=UPI002457DA10|nr:hypothetical protein [Pseudomonas sp. BN414]MDH4566609.1 hypothetical protein [Pseudomonas sp. BN414]